MTQILVQLVKIIGDLPLKWRQKLGSFLGFLFSKLNTRERTIAALQIEIFCNQNSFKLSDLYSHFGKVSLEALNLSKLISTVRCTDTELVKDLLQPNKGGTLFLTAHLGNWELLGAWTVAQGFNLSTVAKATEYSILQKVLLKLRQAYKIKLLWRDDPGSTKEIVKRLKRGEAIAALIDQDTSVNSLMIPFFGTLAKTPSALVDIAKRLGTRICVILIVKEELCYQARLYELDNSLSTVEILTKFNELLEQSIRLHPEQWVWFHKRWRSFPDGNVLRSSEYIEYLKNIKKNNTKATL